MEKKFKKQNRIRWFQGNGGFLLVYSIFKEWKKWGRFYLTGFRGFYKIINCARMKTNILPEINILFIGAQTEHIMSYVFGLGSFSLRAKVDQ